MREKRQLKRANNRRLLEPIGDVPSAAAGGEGTEVLSPGNGASHTGLTQAIRSDGDAGESMRCRADAWRFYRMHLAKRSYSRQMCLAPVALERCS